MKKIIFLITLAAFGQSSAQLSSSLTACYALNGNATDPVSSLNGTLGAVTATVDRNNNSGSALSFTGGVASKITLPNNIKIKSNELSFSAWVKPSLSNSTQYIVFTKNTAVSNFEAYALSVSSGGVFTITKGNNGTLVNVVGTQTIGSNTWHHVAFTFDEYSLKLYLDGTLEGSSTSTLAVGYDGTKNVILGGSAETFNLPYTGSMDNIRFYNRVISASEVTQLYTQDPSCINLTVDLSSSLTACYALNGNANDPISALNGTLGAVVSANDRNNNASAAISFSGTSSSTISLPDDSRLKASEMGFSAWVKPTGSTGSQYILFTKNTSASNFEAYALNYNSSSGIFTAVKGNNGNVVTASSTNSVSLNTWHHVAMTFNTNHLEIYVNGVLEGSNSNSLAVGYQSGKGVYLGDSGEGFSLPFTGLMDNIRFYNRQINSSEVSALYSQDPACVTTPTVSPTTDLTSTSGEPEINLFPNPTTGKLQLFMSEHQHMNCRVMDLLGNTLFEKSNVDEKLLEFDLQLYPKGLYLLVIDVNGKRVTKKIIKD